MSPQRRTALVSVFAALVLIALKLVAGIHSGSLGLLSEAAHSGTDLVAALLTFFAIGVAGRPPDIGHPYGHGKAENLGALTEAAILVVAALVIAASSVFRLIQGGHEVHVDAFALGVIGVVVVVDASRAYVSFGAARRYQSAAFAMNVLHFGGDLAGSLAVLVGLLAARAGYPEGDAIAALFVSVLVLTAAARLIQGNVDVLMDRSPLVSARGGARGDRGARARSTAAPAPNAASGRAPLRRRRHRGSPRRRGRAGPRGGGRRRAGR